MSSVPAGHRNRSCEDRFYSPPAMRRHHLQQQQQQRKSEQHLSSRVNSKSSKSSVESEKRIESNDDCASTATTTTSSFSSPRINVTSSNLDMFIEHTTPVVNAHYLPKTSVKGWRVREDNVHPYFVLGDLWDSFKEWSAYGAGVPLLLNGTDSVIQYYVPYLSGIQLYIDPSKPITRIRRPGEESDGDSSRGGTSSDGSSIDTNNLQPPHHNLINAATQNVNKVSIRNNYVTAGPAVDENDIRSPPGTLAFEYFEHVQPYSREPLADKISVLTSQFPQLRTYNSCDLTSSSWVSVAWYPIYRIPIGQSLQNLDACFLTFHSLSTPLGGTSSERPHSEGLTVREPRNGELPSRLSLPIFGFAAYKCDPSVWSSNDGANESQKVSSLLQAADNWLRCLQVHHPDFTFFLNRSQSR